MLPSAIVQGGSMGSGGRVAVSVLGGYLLGRSHKTRLAVLLALLAASGRLPDGVSGLLRRTALGGSLDQIAGDLRTRLSSAGSSIAEKAASSPVDSLSDILHERTEALHAEGWGGRAAERAGSLLEAPKKTAGIPHHRKVGEPERHRERTVRRGRDEHGRDERGRGEEAEYRDEYEDLDADVGGAYEGDEELVRTVRRRPVKKRTEVGGDE
jgi:hypothetical protein